ncbi:MAG: prevent-host-death protein [Gammaproteobacteria bacterium RIFCSPHIGHO2_12_FULL_37_34]|nr:MAG: prevent-host-death protein [Gammaproteobacteria bacterium RIFCSPHIGHO2_12_FULL_37_34]
MRNWQLQEAKAQLSLVVKEAMRDGPQRISLRGEPAVIVLSIKEYDKLTQPKLSFIKFIRQSPLMGIKLRLKRHSSLTRDIDL